MKGVTSAYLENADQFLAKARIVLDVNLPDEAGRLAYLAMFHAAQALIFERTDRAAKTHKGVSRQLHRLALEAGLDSDLPPALSNAYRLKQATDYAVGLAVPITREVAVDALAAADRLVFQVRHFLSAHDDGSS